MKQEHEMTPGVLVSGDMAAGDYKARCAVLEDELADLRKRACVPEGWRVLAPTSTTLRHGERWEVYGPSGGGIVNADDVKDWVVRGLLDAIAAPAPVERNQCDGCQAGIPVESGMHRMGKPGGYADLMACTADRYGSAPVERVEPKTGVLVGEPEIVGERCADGGTCHHGCTDECWRKTGCGPLTCSGLNDDWSSPPAGFSVYRCPHCAASMQIATPQPAPTAAQDVAGPTILELMEQIDAVRMSDEEAMHHGRGAAYWNNAVCACLDAARKAYQSGGAK